MFLKPLLVRILKRTPDTCSLAATGTFRQGSFLFDGSKAGHGDLVRTVVSCSGRSGKLLHDWRHSHTKDSAYSKEQGLFS